MHLSHRNVSLYPGLIKQEVAKRLLKAERARHISRYANEVDLTNRKLLNIDDNGNSVSVTSRIRYFFSFLSL